MLRCLGFLDLKRTWLFYHGKWDWMLLDLMGIILDWLAAKNRSCGHGSNSYCLLDKIEKDDIGIVLTTSPLCILCFY